MTVTVNDLLDNVGTPDILTDFKRDRRWGRPLVVPAAGGKARLYLRPSAASREVDDTYNLELHKNRNVTWGVATEPSLVARVLAVGGTPHEWGKAEKEAINKVVEDAAKVAKSYKAADIGTAIHKLTEHLDHGRPVNAGPYQPDLDAYQQALDTAGVLLHPGWIECRLVCDELEMAGTADRIVNVAPGSLLANHLDTPHCLIADIKGLALSTPIPTPSGWTTMGEVAVGDVIYASDGSACQVAAKSRTKRIGTYVVHFDDGAQVVCDKEHIWWTTTDGKEPTPKPIAEVIATLTSERGQKHHRVPVAGPLQTADMRLPIDPYLLGCWLGDGHARGGVISKGRDLFAILAADGHALGVEQIDTRTDQCIARTVLGLTPLLRDEGLLHNKHIPAAYLRAGMRQRRRLLQGLMDTDGTWNTARRTAVFNSTDKGLALAVEELLLSLGQRPHFAAVQTRGFGLDVTAYAVQFTPADINPFRLPRKADQAAASTKPTTWARRRVIVAVEPGPDVETACIAVDSTNRTYLCGDRMVPTHNTGQSIDYGGLNWGAQLAVYANSDLYDPATDTRMHTPAINRDRGLIIHLPAGQGRCDLYLVDIRSGYQAAELANQIRATRKHAKGWLTPVTQPVATRDEDVLATLEASVVGPVAPVDVPSTVQGLRARLNNALDTGAVVPWPGGVPTFKQGGPTTWAQILQVERVVLDAEKAAGLPFPEEGKLPADPTAVPVERDLVPPVGLSAAPLLDPPLDRTTLDELNRVHDSLPEDLQRATYDAVAAAGVPTDRRQWRDSHRDNLTLALQAIVFEHEERIERVESLLLEWDDEAIVVALVQAIGHADADLHRVNDFLQDFQALEVDALAALVEALDQGSIAITWSADGTPTVTSNAATEPALLFAYENKTAVLTAAKRMAAAHGRSVPRSTAAAASDPVLAALLLTNQPAKEAQ